MRTISELHTKLKEFDGAARRAESPDAIAGSWKRIFNMNIGKESANSFARYYKEMRSTRRGKQSGGSMLSPAPLAAPAMVPGLNVTTYGSFPEAIHDIDAYFNQAQLKGCGTEDISLQVPKDMGSNQVGGSGRRDRRGSRRAARKTYRAARKTYRGGKRRATKSTLRRRRSQRGGDLMTSLASRFSFSTAPPNGAQIVQHISSGGTGFVPAPASPVHHVWDYKLGNNAAMTNTSVVANIGDSFSRLASPTPWLSSS